MDSPILLFAHTFATLLWRVPVYKGHFCPSALPVVVGTGCLETAETFWGAAMEKYEKIKVVGRGAFG